MVDIIKRHRIFAVYIVSLTWLLVSLLWFGFVANHGMEHAPYVLVLILAMIFCYGVVWRLLLGWIPSLSQWMSGSDAEHPALSSFKWWALVALTIVYIAVAFLHMTMLEDIPILKALSSDSERGISVIRQEGYFGLPVWLRYASDYSLKGLGPALLLISYYYRTRIFWWVLAAGILYSMALFVRVLPIILLMPLMFYMLLQRRWLHLALVGLLLWGMVFTATSVSAPGIRETLIPERAKEIVSARDVAAAKSYEAFTPLKASKDLEVMEEDAVSEPKSWRSSSAVYALLERVLFVPGQVMDQWFYFYREPDMWEGGCGYRVIAAILGCKYVPIPTKLYQAFYEDNVRGGMQGSLNAASFMTEYANFGPYGLLLSALLSAVIFCLAGLIYRDHELALPVNIPLILISMETSIVTALNSGAGWVVMTVLFLFFFRRKTT